MIYVKLMQKNIHSEQNKIAKNVYANLKKLFIIFIVYSTYLQGVLSVK